MERQPMTLQQAAMNLQGVANPQSQLSNSEMLQQQLRDKQQAMLNQQQLRVQGAQQQLADLQGQGRPKDYTAIAALADMFRPQGSQGPSMTALMSGIQGQRNNQYMNQQRMAQQELQNAQRAYDQGQMAALKGDLQEAQAADRFDMQKALLEQKQAGEMDRQRFSTDEAIRLAEAKADIQKENPSKPKKFNDNEWKSGTFAARMRQAEGVFGDLVGEGYKRENYEEGVMAGLFNTAKDENLRRHEQAERNFLNAVLRKESGAVISEEEFKSGALQYFPRAGDTDQVLEQKRQNRELAISAMAESSSGAFDKVMEKYAKDSSKDQIKKAKEADKKAAKEAPDFDSMSDAELEAYIQGGN